MWCGLKLDNTLAGICYLYLLCSARSKMKEREEEEAWRRGRSGGSREKGEGRPKNVYNPI